MKKSKTVELKEIEKEKTPSYCFGDSHIGMVRGANEDSFAIKARGNSCLLGVFDGMGGMEKGEVASSIAKETFLQIASDNVNWSREMIKKMFKEINRKIYDLSRSSHIEGKMGTTGAIALIEDHYLHCANVGDSRIYILKNKELKQITNDHTLIAMQLKNGIISKEEAKRSSMKNILVRAIGVKESVEPEFYAPIKIESDDIVLLCSDGLYNMVNERLIKKILVNRHLDIKEKVKKLIDTANKNGGADNITVVLFDKRKVLKRRPLWIFWIIIILTAIVLVWIFGKQYIQDLFKAVVNR